MVPREDRELTRALARRLADEGSDAEGLRATVRRTIAGKEQTKGRILQSLRRSPLVGADVEFKRVERLVARWGCEPLSARYEHHQQRNDAVAVTA